MRKTALLLLAAALLSACGTTSDLYSWGGYRNKTSAYEDYAYQYYHRQTPESLCDLLACYEQMVSTPGGSRQVPPPGICAEYGYLLLLPETAVTFAMPEPMEIVFMAPFLPVPMPAASVPPVATTSPPLIATL